MLFVTSFLTDVDFVEIVVASGAPASSLSAGGTSSRSGGIAVLQFGPLNVDLFKVVARWSFGSSPSACGTSCAIACTHSGAWRRLPPDIDVVKQLILAV